MCANLQQIRSVVQIFASCLFKGRRSLSRPLRRASLCSALWEARRSLSRSLRPAWSFGNTLRCTGAPRVDVPYMRHSNFFQVTAADVKFYMHIHHTSAYIDRVDVLYMRRLTSRLTLICPKISSEHSINTLFRV